MVEVIQYTSRQMLAAMKQQVKPDSFLRGKLVNMPDNLSDTKYIEVDDEVVAQGISGYNTRTGEAVEVAKDGYSTYLHVAPYVDEQITLTPADADTRSPGSTIYDGGAASRFATQVNGSLGNLGDRLDRLEEKQVSSVIQTGVISVSNAATGVSYEVDFGLPAANKSTLSGTGVWGGSATDITGNLQTWAKVLSNNGYVATDLIMDQDAANLLLADTAIKAFLDNRRIQMGSIDVKLIAGQRANYIGTLMLPGLTIDLWSYFGGYRTDATTFVNYMTQYRAVMIGSGFGIQPSYGKIENLKSSFVGRRFPNMWQDNRGKYQYVGMESSPCMVARNIRGIFSAIVKS